MAGTQTLVTLTLHLSPELLDRIEREVENELMPVDQAISHAIIDWLDGQRYQITAAGIRALATAERITISKQTEIKRRWCDAHPDKVKEYRRRQKAERTANRAIYLAGKERAEAQPAVRAL